MSQKNIKFIYDKDSKIYNSRKHLILSPIQIANAGDEIIFETQKTDVTVFIPRANELFENVKEKSMTIELNEFEKSKTNHPGLVIKRQGNTGKTGNKQHIYPYAVYFEKENDFGEGFSSPKIIIE